MCWGNNSNGQLGDGTTTDCWAPVEVVGLSSGVAAISAGSGHTCALKSSGEVNCWGNNFWGQLGNGTNYESWYPMGVIGLDGGVASISAGGEYTCVTTASGGAKCWGSNSRGQLGSQVLWVPVDVFGFGGGRDMVYGRVTTLDGSPLPGVTISAGNNISATTNVDGSYIISGLSSGPYTLVPYKDGYTFTPLQSLPVSVPYNHPVDFTAYVLSIIKIEINQGLGSVDQYVAGKHTAIFAFLNNYVHVDSAHQSLTIRRSGRSDVVATLYPQSNKPSTDGLIFLCPLPGCDNWQAGHYTFTI
jgi:hypothetical protein